MKHVLSRPSIALLASIAAVAVSACEPTQPRTRTLDGSEDNYTGGVNAGRRDAENDLRAGILRIKAYGLPGEWRPTYERNASSLLLGSGMHAFSPSQPACSSSKETSSKESAHSIPA